jgi:hypothetical protein
MRFKRRFKLSEQQRSEMWSRWKAGQSLHEVGRAFGKDHVSIQFMLAQHGGIAPAVRRRSPLTLTLAEREEISRGIASGGSIREIAKGLQRAVSTVSREVGPPGGGPPDRGAGCRLSAVRPPPWGAHLSIGPVTRTSKPGTRPCVPSAVCWPCT